MLSSQIRCPKSAITDKRVPALTIAEQQALVEALSKHKKWGSRNEYSKQILIELYTGMRMGEINALRPEDIDFNKGVIHIRGTISMGIDFHGQHSLRHTFATRCIEAGVKPVVLKNWLGHTNIHITLDTYADIYGSLNSASLDTLEKYLEV